MTVQEIIEAAHRNTMGARVSVQTKISNLTYEEAKLINLQVQQSQTPAAHSIGTVDGIYYVLITEVVVFAKSGN